MTILDVTNMTDEELQKAQDKIFQERALRRKHNLSTEGMTSTVAEYQKEHHIGEGEPWQYPITALRAYRLDAEVTHGDHTWFSLIPNNTGEPGVSGWRIKAEVDPETGKEIPPPYVRPAGAHDVYKEGDLITWIDGEIYAAARYGVEWDPDTAPQEWNHVIPAIPIEPPPEDGDDEEPGGDGEPGEVEPGTAENPFAWTQGERYEVEHYVTHDSILYRVIQAHVAGHWTPNYVPALYEVVVT